MSLSKKKQDDPNTDYYSCLAQLKANTALNQHRIRDCENEIQKLGNEITNLLKENKRGEARKKFMQQKKKQQMVEVLQNKIAANQDSEMDIQTVKMQLEQTKIHKTMQQTYSNFNKAISINSSMNLYNKMSTDREKLDYKMGITADINEEIEEKLKNTIGNSEIDDGSDFDNFVLEFEEKIALETNFPTTQFVSQTNDKSSSSIAKELTWEEKLELSFSKKN